jgi:hypothetical protein
MFGGVHKVIVGREQGQVMRPLHAPATGSVLPIRNPDCSALPLLYKNRTLNAESSSGVF